MPATPGRLLRRWWLGVATAAAAFAFAATMPAYAALGTDVVKVSDDPFTNAASQHRTEDEADTFSFGASCVSGMQVGRIFHCGASYIGWATSIGPCKHFVPRFLPRTTPFTTPAGVYDRASD